MVQEAPLGRRAFAVFTSLIRIIIIRIPDLSKVTTCRRMRRASAGHGSALITPNNQKALGE